MAKMEKRYNQKKILFYNNIKWQKRKRYKQQKKSEKRNNQKKIRKRYNQQKKSVLQKHPLMVFT